MSVEAFGLVRARGGDRQRRSWVAHVVAWALGVVVVAGGAGCQHFETNLQDTEVSYLQTARQNFEQGQTALDDGNEKEAIKYFEYVKNKYPYSKYAQLADLRIADAQFAMEKWLEAADAYRLFARFHPRHPDVPYALFRVGLSYTQDIGGDYQWIPFMPPVREKDQSAIQDAIGAFDEYLRRFPDDKNADEARKLRTETRTKLADHDMYAAEFYAQRNRWKGAVRRYETVSTRFDDTPLAPKALFRMATIYADELDDQAQAAAVLGRLIERYPEAPETQQARTLRERLQPAVEEQAQAEQREAEAAFQAEIERGPEPGEPPASIARP